MVRWNMLARLLVLPVAGLLAGAASVLPVDWNGLSGRYGRHFQVSAYGGGTEAVDDVLELVPLPEQGAFYYRARAHFGGGQKCAAYGILHREGPRLAYRAEVPVGPTFDGKGQCLLTLSALGNKLVFKDDGGRCGIQMCGAKGSLDKVSFPRASQRPISYLDRLKDSYEFKDAVSEHARMHSARR